ncbi:MAG: OmpA family protein [Polyangiaceae bacterium]|nr:OmpA family protein [Polyangiaceae bacterium]
MALLVAACSNEKAPAKDASGAGFSGSIAASEKSARNDRETTIVLPEDIRRECQLPNAPREAPRFEFNQATLRSRGRNILDDVANCMSKGPLKGRIITIIGRTDPRGSTEHNQELATNRAEAARNYLAQRGVPTDTIRIWSRGEHGAQGTNEETWALDRRVDFELGDRTVAGETAANPSPILEGTRIQALTPGAKQTNEKAAPYADQAEGGKVSGGSP